MEAPAIGTDQSGVRRRALWAFADQGLSSLTNFACSIFAARSATLEEFGGFALTISVYFLVSGLGQAVAGQPLVVRYSGADRSGRRTAGARATGTALLLGVGAGIVAALVGMSVGRGVGPPLVALGVLLPGLLLQDAWRFHFVSDGRPDRAVVNDGAWAVMQAVGFALLIHAGLDNPTTLLEVWGASAGLAAILGWAQSGIIPSLSTTFSWLRDHRDLITPYSGELVVTRGSYPLALVLISAIVGLAAVGAVRAVQLLFAPVNLAYQGALFAAVPEGVRLLAVAPQRFMRYVSATAAITVAGVAIWTLAVATLPDNVGHGFLGATWTAARPLLWTTAAYNVAISVGMGPQVGLRALGAARLSLSVQFAQASMAVVGAVIGALRAGAFGAMVGLAVGTAVGALVWWAVIVRERRRPGTAASALLRGGDDSESF
jgi:O-antigen/teichoic acid export membrane protein